MGYIAGCSASESMSISIIIYVSGDSLRALIWVAFCLDLPLPFPKSWTLGVMALDWALIRLGLDCYFCLLEGTVACWFCRLVVVYLVCLFGLSFMQFARNSIGSSGRYADVLLS